MRSRTSNNGSRCRYAQRKSRRKGVFVTPVLLCRPVDLLLEPAYTRAEKHVPTAQQNPQVAVVEQLLFIELVILQRVAFNLVGQRSTGVRKMAPQFGVDPSTVNTAQERVA